MIKVLIPEDIPSHNKGEAALFHGLKESLRPYGEFSLTLFTTNPELDLENYKKDAAIVDARSVTPAHMLDGQAGKARKALNYTVFIGKHALFAGLWKLLGERAVRLMKGPVWTAYSKADLILMSHDSFYTPLYHGIQALVFKTMGKPAIIYAATVKPASRDRRGLKSRLLDIFVAFSSRRLSSITLREDLSLTYLRELGLGNGGVPIRVHPDLAFLLPPISGAEASDILSQERVPESRPLIGMAISQRKLDFAFPGQAMADRRERALAPITELTDYLAGELGATIVFVPHSIGPTPVLDDRIVADMIREKSRYKNRLHVLRREYTPSQLKGLAALLDMTVGTRLHFAIDAICSGVPSLLITHDGDLRCHGIIGNMLGLSEYVYNIDAIDAVSLKETVQRLWENREPVRGHIEECIGEIKKETYRHGENAVAVYRRSLQENP